MAKHIILLTKEDINCSPIGEHLQIVTADGLFLNLNQEAVDELKSSIEEFLVWKAENSSEKD